jgi:hypothetical protein
MKEIITIKEKGNKNIRAPLGLEGNNNKTKGEIILKKKRRRKPSATRFEVFT